MADKPKRASEYKSEQVELVKATCLYAATKLGDMMDDLVIVGGLVPSLLIDQATLPADVALHVGTMDLDVGLQIALLNEGRYRQLTERLRDAGFTMDKNDAGNPTRQRWAITSGSTVTVDFLIQPSREGDKGGKLRDIEPDFAAIIAPGLRCAFRDHEQVTLKGKTLFGEKATRDIWVSGAGAYPLGQDSCSRAKSGAGFSAGRSGGITTRFVARPRTSRCQMWCSGAWETTSRSRGTTRRGQLHVGHWTLSSSADGRWLTPRTSPRCCWRL